jgi:mRNA interferase RelE/StbE
VGDRPYRVDLVASARRTLDGLPINPQRRIIRSLRRLEIDPRPRGVTRVVGRAEERVWRIRVGDYRVLYEVRDELLVVLVIRRSAEAEHREILQAALREDQDRVSFKALLASMPDVGEDVDFLVPRDLPRESP